MSDEMLPESWTPVENEDVHLPYPNGKKIRQGWSPQGENYPAESHVDWAVGSPSRLSWLGSRRLDYFN